MKWNEILHFQMQTQLSHLLEQDFCLIGTANAFGKRDSLAFSWWLIDATRFRHMVRDGGRSDDVTRHVSFAELRQWPTCVGGRSATLPLQRGEEGKKRNQYRVIASLERKFDFILQKEKPRNLRLLEWYPVWSCWQRRCRNVVRRLS